jgi:hypothetical protein
MPFDIIEIDLTVDGDSAHAVGDVVFALTEFPLPARACIVTNAFLFAEGTALEECVLKCMFFKSNNGGELGDLNGDADISAANFKLNKCVGEISLIQDAGLTQQDIDKINNIVMYQMHSGIAQNTSGTGGGGTMSLVLKGSEDTSFSHGMYVSGIQASGAQDYGADQTDVKLILHVEY